jgi:hypothetical protein
MLGIIAVIFLLSAIAVAADASHIGAHKGLITGLGNMAPSGWFFAVLLLWIIALPLYLTERPRIRAATRVPR